MNKAVERNIKRFSKGFIFKLQMNEHEFLRFQIRTSKRGGRQYYPYVFTEQGIAMLSSVLRSKKAIRVNIAIVRAFVKLREVLSTHKALAAKLKQFENKVGQHDGEIKLIFQAIKQMMIQPKQGGKKYGFKK